MAEDDWQPKLDLYVDSELSAEEMREVDEHLRGCPTCAGETLRRLQLKRATRVAGRRYIPSTEFRSRIEQQVTARRSRGRHWFWIPALSMAAVLLIAGSVATARWYEGLRSQQLLAELADLHVANLSSTTPVDVVSSDRHTVKPWFQGKLPFTFDLPELQGKGFTLVGGRLSYLQHEPGAHLLFDVGNHHISVFIFAERPEIERAFPKHDSSGRILSFHVQSWSTNGLRYFVFGDASPEAIGELSRLLEHAAS